MPSPRKRKELDVDDSPIKEDESDTDDEEDEKKRALSSLLPSTVSCTVLNGNNTPAKLKCLKCHRAARKDCTGNLCIRCCSDENCLVHREQRAKNEWREAVVAGTTDVQRRAKHKRSRAIPRGRFKERAFRYMNDTVLLWDLRTVLVPAPPTKAAAAVVTPPSSHARHEAAAVAAASSLSSSSVSAEAMLQYQSDLKVSEDILRRSRKNNHSSSLGEQPMVPSKCLRRNYRGTRKRFRNAMEDLYRKSLD